jgi:preprotein translocase subunit YajC
MELIGTLVILLLVVAAYWSLVVLPKQQEFKKHQRYVREIRPGQRVVTYGGIIGTVTALDPDQGEATVEIAPGIEVRIITAALTQPYNPAELARSARIAADEIEQH